MHYRPLKGICQQHFLLVFVTSILYIAIGVLLAIFRSGSLDIAMTIAGVFFIISGVLDLVKKNYVGGAVSAGIGVAIILLGWLATKIVLLILGILIAVKGVIALIEVIKKASKNVLEMIFPVLSIVLGLMLAFGYGLDLIILIVGIVLAVNGVIGLLGALKK